MPLFGQDRPDPRIMRGGQVLGDILTGNVGTPGVYEQTLGDLYDAQSKGYTRDEKMAQAAMARARSIAHAGLPARALAYADSRGFPSELGALIEGFAGAGDGNNFSSFMGGVERGDNMDNRTKVAGLLELGEIPAANKLSAAYAGRDYQPIRAEGGAYINDGATLGDLDMVPTLPTMISQQSGLASQENAYASAAATRQRAAIAQNQFGLEQAGLWNPDGVSEQARAVSTAAAPKPLPAEIRLKLGMLEAAEAAARKYEQEVLPQGGGFNRQSLYVGPAGGNIEEAINNVLRVESGAAVPESEVRSGVRRYGATAMNQEDTARANLRQLYDKISILRQNITNQTGTVPAVQFGGELGEPAPAAAPARGARRRFNPATGRVE